VKCQFGLLHTSGKPATLDDLATLLADFEDRPSDLAGEILDGPLVMAFRGDRIAVEEDFETQPLKQWDHVITWDGRLDNRDEMASRLPLNKCDDISDPAIVLKSYKALGQSVFKDLVGEFALTMWCKKTRTLRFVRSTCGARPLFYSVVKGTLFWSSDFAHLVRVSGCDLEVNKTYFLEYIVTQPSTSLTPLSKLNAVPANTLLRVEDGRVAQVEKLWNGAEVAPLNYSDDRQYEEHFRDVLTQAVRVRMRAKSPIFAELSGGLDSSSIVLTADEVLRAKNFPYEQIQIWVSTFCLAVASSAILGNSKTLRGHRRFKIGRLVPPAVGLTVANNGGARPEAFASSEEPRLRRQCGCGSTTSQPEGIRRGFVRSIQTLQLRVS
jgi:asparagine synthase (glutamine-hydrolysing)